MAWLQSACTIRLKHSHGGTETPRPNLADARKWLLVAFPHGFNKNGRALDTKRVNTRTGARWTPKVSLIPAKGIALERDPTLLFFQAEGLVHTGQDGVWARLRPRVYGDRRARAGRRRIWAGGAGEVGDLKRGQ